MVERFDCLYSTGKGAVGPGTWVSQSIFNPKKNRGAVTRMYKDTNGIQATALASLYTLSDAAFPGTAIPLNYTYVKQLSDTLALVVSHYGSSSGSNGFKRVMSREPNGYRSIPTWPRTSGALADYSEKKSNYQNGRLAPTKTIYAPLKVIRWSSLVYSDNRPSDNASLQGKYNVNTYYIDGYEHAPYTLKFGGTYIAHDKWGAYDRWTLRHAVTYDPLYKWRYDFVEPETEDKPIPKKFVRPDDNGLTIYDDNELAVFPNLP